MLLLVHRNRVVLIRTMKFTSLLGENVQFLTHSVHNMDFHTPTI